MINTIVIASGNAGKIVEIRDALRGYSVALPTQADFGVDGADETGVTFVENALIKARAVAAATGLSALADDSGLVVPALGNAPGLYSARYAGAQRSDADNNAKLLREMADIVEGDRAAYYYAVIVFIRSESDPRPVIAEGVWRGVIARAAAGGNGFGYDPLFYDEAVGKTGGEMQLAEKQQRSHRAQSLRNLTTQLKTHQILPPRDAE